VVKIGRMELADVVEGLRVLNTLNAGLSEQSCKKQ
jgi:hypothetical protein